MAMKFLDDNKDGLTTRNVPTAEAHSKAIQNQFSKMENKWQNDFLDEVMEKDENLFEELSKKVKDTSNQVNICINAIDKAIRDFDLGTVASSASVSASAPRTLKPDKYWNPGILSASSNLEEYNAWEETFLAHVDQNKDFLAASTVAVRRVFVTSQLDATLRAALATDTTVTDQTPIVATGDDASVMKWLKKHILRHRPLFIRRFQYSSCKQKPKESFGDWWTRKLTKAKECELDTADRESIEITELICGIVNPELRKEILKLREPTLEELVTLGTRFDTAAAIQKTNFGDVVSANKTSDYKRGKNEKFTYKKDADKSGDSKSGDSKIKCKHCGGTPCFKLGKNNVCKAKDMECFFCGNKGHIKPACQKRAEKTVVSSKAVHVKRVVAKWVEDDCEATPTCKMAFRTNKGREFFKEVLPDTGSSQTIIAMNLVNANDMPVDKKKKRKIFNASDEPMACEGTVTFEVEYEGQKTNVAALVSSDLTNEVLLGWKALKRLKIIPDNFPHVSEICKVQNVGAEAAAVDLGPDPRANIEKAMEAFPEVFEEPGLDGGQLKPMKGGPMSIHLKPGPIKPTHIYTARRCPYAFEGYAKAELDKSESLGIIEKVEGASIWCSPMSFVRKPGGGCRSVVDLKGLNDHVLRPTHPFPASKDIIATIPKGSKVFAVFDCYKGYWQVELDEKSRPLTTFLTEFGRYRYLRAPMGLNSSGDEFCRRTDEAMEGLVGVKKLVDDILIYAPDDKVLLERILGVFKRCHEWGITLAKAKFQYGKSVKFAGFIVSEEGSKPDPDKVASIRDFPSPKDITNLRSFMGLVNQFATYAPDLKHAMVPLQPLLKPKNVYQWLPEHEEAFKTVKNILTSEEGPVLAQFDPKLPVVLITDASRLGLGYILAQDDGLGGHTRLITCGSRFLSPAEANYAVIELECMAIQWAILKCRNYLLGVDFVVKTDHKSLLGVINGKDLDAVNNARLQRMLSKLLGFQYKVEYVPGKLNLIADALSRSPVFQPDAEEVDDVLVQALKVEVEPMDPQLLQIVEAAAKCSEYQRLTEVVKGTLSLNKLPTDHPARKYRYFLKAMAFEVGLGLLTVHGRIVVPKEARKAVLQSLHIQHTGIVKTWKNARQLYCWPGLKNDIVQLVGNCQECVMHLPSLPKEPCIQTKASRPFEAVSVDLGQLDGVHYLIGADRFSGWPMVAKLTKLETSAITNVLTDWFVDVGKPLRLRSDGGPQFRSEFADWCQEQGIEHELASPDHHESNGHAESAVKAMKHLLAKKKSWRAFRKALIEWRNTPRCSDSLSPAQWALGRRQRSSCPALPGAYARLSDQDFSEAMVRREEVMAKVKKDFDKDRRSLTKLPVGTLVVLQNRPIGAKPGRWNRKGSIVERKSDRTYIVEVGDRRFSRNRRFLRPCLNQDDPEVGAEAAAVDLGPEPKGQRPESEREPLRRSKRHGKGKAKEKSGFIYY